MFKKKKGLKNSKYSKIEKNYIKGLLERNGGKTITESTSL